MPQDRKADGADEEQEFLYLKQRRAVNDAYASLLGQSVADTFAAFTFEEAVDAQIERIEGKGTETHPNLLNRTEAIRQNLVQAVTQLKKVPPEKFLDVNLTDAVNTPEEDPLSEEEQYRARLQQFNG
jgi:hypothetical protein